jgi:alpha-amylase
MPSVCFYFQVHQPFRVKETSFLEIGSHPDYFQAVTKNTDNKAIFEKVSYKCYYPTNQVILDMLNQYPEFKVSYSISGVFLEQALMWDQGIIESFQALARTGRVEFIAETYYHSLSYLYSTEEFKNQVQKQQDLIYKLFGQKSQVFRNTELIYTDSLAQVVKDLGFNGIITEGVDKYLNGRSPNFLYNSANNEIKMLLKNYNLSDDIAFRFSNQQWNNYPLKADTFAQWIDRINGYGEVVNLFMDYETFGEHQWAESGIFEFLKNLPKYILTNNDFILPSEAVKKYHARDNYSVGNNVISWADSERDLSAWRSNEMQEDALRQIYKLESEVKELNNSEITEKWQKLTTSDHFYYMCTKFWSDGDVHAYFSPFSSPYEAYINYMNCLKDFKVFLQKQHLKLEIPVFSSNLYSQGVIT